MMSAENLLVVNVLPENDPTAQAAIQVLKQSSADVQVIHAYEQDFRPCVGCKRLLAGDAGYLRHVPRYDKKFRFGLLYEGAADRNYLNRWMERVMLNFDGESLGAYPIENAEEVAMCI